MGRVSFFDFLNNGTISANSKDLTRARFFEKSRSTTTSSVLPFRVKFSNVGVEAYGPNNPAPIGIAVIGLNNYIL